MWFRNAETYLRMPSSGVSLNFSHAKRHQAEDFMWDNNNPENSFMKFHAPEFLRDSSLYAM